MTCQYHGSKWPQVTHSQTAAYTKIYHRHLAVFSSGVVPITHSSSARLIHIHRIHSQSASRWLLTNVLPKPTEFSLFPEDQPPFSISFHHRLQDLLLPGIPCNILHSGLSHLTQMCAACPSIHHPQFSYRTNIEATSAKHKRPHM